jgi:hypothetical protein
MEFLKFAKEYKKLFPGVSPQEVNEAYKISIRGKLSCIIYLISIYRQKFCLPSICEDILYIGITLI